MQHFPLTHLHSRFVCSGCVALTSVYFSSSVKWVTAASRPVRNKTFRMIGETRGQLLSRVASVRERELASYYIVEAAGQWHLWSSFCSVFLSEKIDSEGSRKVPGQTSWQAHSSDIARILVPTLSLTKQIFWWDLLFLFRFLIEHLWDCCFPNQTPPVSRQCS